ncbi:MAG: hydroxymethylbilane synthase [Candidatus Korobacteraceae bacterium]
MSRLRIGSRGSQLALWQANHIADQLRSRDHQIEIEVIKTTGDKITDVALSKVGTKGMFTKEIEEALLEHRVDLAVHSLKDLPTELSSEFEIAAITEREDPRDAFVSRNFGSVAGLPQRSRVGTSSLRRQAQLMALRADLLVLPLRGNVDTRLRKLEDGEYDAIILAHAGLTRLGRTELVRSVLPPSLMCPAAGQGALAIEIRSGDAETRRSIEFLNHLATRDATLCERELLNSMGGGCQVPIGAYAEPNGSRLRLTAVVARPDGSEVIREFQEGSDPAKLGRRVGQALLKRGGDEILRDVYAPQTLTPTPQQP